MSQHVEEINVYILDDVRESRTLLAEVAGAISRVVVCGSAAPSQTAFEQMGRTAVDVVLLSANTGLEMLRSIRKQYPAVGVILVSDAEKRHAELAMDALVEGALGFVRRPQAPQPGDGHADLVRQIFPLICTFQTRRTVQLTQAQRPQGSHGLPQTSPRSVRAGHRVRRHPSGRIGLVAIGVSTGGPEALDTVVRTLPKDLGVPVLVVQHMPPVFTQSLAVRLDRVCALDVQEAIPGEPIEPNRVLIAPGGRHMVVKAARNGSRSLARLTVGIHDGPPVHACRPSVDTLFLSLAEQRVPGVLAVVMTGMGSDGCAGVRALKVRGAYCITQTETTCAVYGMPKAVDDAGLSDEQVALNGIGARIDSLVHASRSAVFI